MRVIEITPKGNADVLPGADFADAWRLDGLPADDAPSIAARAFWSAPKWVDALLALRNLLVMPFRLKTGTMDLPKPQETVGIFPVVSQRPDRIVLGIDDRHLDFRVVVDVTPTHGRTVSATATTFVRTHNAGGRIYLALVKPFHRVIVRTMLKRAAA